MKPQSAKAKGRRLQQYVRDTLLAAFDLPADDIRSTSMGAGGEDILLSTRAKELIPFAIEVKNVQSLNIWKAIAQAESHLMLRDSRSPLVVFSRNEADVMCALPFKDLVQLLIHRAYP